MSVHDVHVNLCNVYLGNKIVRCLVAISGSGNRSAKAKDLQCPDQELSNLDNEKAYTLTMIKKVQGLS